MGGASSVARRGPFDRGGGDVPDLAARRARLGTSEVTSYIGMVVFLGSWAMMFAALFFSYALVRSRAPVWPPLGVPVPPLVLPAVNTAVIAASSAAVAAALRAAMVGRRARVGRALAVATVLGAAFLALQSVVWIGLWRDGLRIEGGTYPSVFYSLTALHALHVAVGVVALAVLAMRALRAPGPTRVAVRLWGMYWHFVGIVWGVLYATVYLL
jgi:cytochrome c oxidase subunit III